MTIARATYAEIGRSTGVSRQRVQQLLAPPMAVRQEDLRQEVEQMTGLRSAARW